MTMRLNAALTGGTARTALALALLGSWAGFASAQTTPPPAQAGPANPATTAPATTTASGTVEVGAGGVSSGSFKAGEFNGLENKGAFGIGNIDLRGGAPYDSDSAFHWRIKGLGVGLENRSVAGEVGVQGRFRVTAGYDVLRRNRSDSYQTPYTGAGTNMLTLPSSWLAPVIASSSSSNNHTTTVSARGLDPSIGAAPYLDTQTTSPTAGKVIAPNASQLAAVNGAAAADAGLFHNVDLFTKRTRYDGGLSVNLAPAWVVDVSLRAEHKDGLKPMSTVSRTAGGDIATVIPDLIDTDTSQVSSSLAYRGDRGSFQGGYYGSLFTNHVTSMSWQNWASPARTLNTMSSAPGNTLHQFNFEGRYNLSTSTRLVANGSYGRNTQNDAFLVDASTPVVPVTSLNGLVLWKSAGAKLTTRLRKVNLLASYTFDDRDNRTAVHVFQFADAGETPSPNANFPASAGNPLGAVVAQNANANRPYSKKNNLGAVQADYAVAKGQWIRAGYDYERINRWCAGSWIDCADAGVTNEHRGLAEWRAEIGERVNVRVDYTYGARRAPNYNENAFLALVPYANVSAASATGGATAYSFMVLNGWNGWGPTAGYSPTTGNMNLFFPSNNALANASYANNNRISEIQGLRRYYVSDRNRNRVRSLLDWEASDSLSLEAGLDYTGDDYPGSTYGLQSSKSWSANVDGTYAMGDSVSATLFYSFEHQRAVTAGNTYTANSNTASVNGFTALSGNACDTFTTLQQRNNNNKLDPCLNWSANMLDRANTVGVTLLKKTAKLNLQGDAIYTRARSTNDVSGGSWANNLLALPGAPAGTVAAYFIPATPLPVVTTNTFELRARGTYEVAAHQSVRLVYSYLRMRSSDWAYDGMQIGAGAVSSVLPTSETAFNYGVHVVGLSYVIGF